MLKNSMLKNFNVKKLNFNYLKNKGGLKKEWERSEV